MTVIACRTQPTSTQRSSARPLMAAVTASGGASTNEPSSSSRSSLIEPTSASAEATPPLAKARVYVKNRYVFVRSRPDASADWLGFLWFGASVELRGLTPVSGPGCATYYAIEPRGFVCVDEQQATLHADDE